MKILIVSALSALLLNSAWAGKPFRIGSISQSSYTLDRSVMGDRRAKLQTIEALDVKVSVTEDTPSKGVRSMGYFFTRDYKPLGAQGPAVEEWKNMPKGGNAITLPSVLQLGQIYPLQFSLTLMPDVAGKWKRMVMIFGTKGNYTAKVYPSGDLSNFDFPEKSEVKD